MLKNYQPFGKPGAGAPIYQSYHNRQKFAECDLWDDIADSNIADVSTSLKL